MFSTVSTRSLKPWEPRNLTFIVIRIGVLRVGALIREIIVLHRVDCDCQSGIVPIELIARNLWENEHNLSIFVWININCHHALKLVESIFKKSRKIFAHSFYFIERHFLPWGMIDVCSYHAGSVSDFSILQFQPRKSRPRRTRKWPQSTWSSGWHPVSAPRCDWFGATRTPPAGAKERG